MRTKIILVLAVMMGLITTVLFYNYMKKFDHEAAATEHMAQIVSAKQAINKNQKISADMLETIQVPQAGVHSGTVQNSADVVGKYATADIAQGEPVLRHRIMQENEESLFVSRKIKEGHRAVSVGVNFVQSVSNLIEPEDYVDVIFSEQDPVSREVKTELILQKVRVLAVGRRMLEPDSGVEYVEYNSATLELKSADTVKLVNADERGNIQLVLHSRVIPPASQAK
jgi:pilus assembly protein CpaB